MRLALYQPDIPQNTGTILRLAACLNLPVDIIGPAGFDMSDKALRRAALDYLDDVAITRHIDWPAFVAASAAARIVLITSHGSVAVPDFAFQPGDVILMGRESAGVPQAVHEAAFARLRIPIRPHCARSTSPSRPEWFSPKHFVRHPAGLRNKKLRPSRGPEFAFARMSGAATAGRRRRD